MHTCLTRTKILTGGKNPKTQLPFINGGSRRLSGLNENFPYFFTCQQLHGLLMQYLKLLEGTKTALSFEQP